MLPKKHRLNKKIDIARVFKTGSKHTSPYMLIFYKATPQKQPARIACVVSKKVHSSSVRRNKYQRWMRQIAGHVIALQPAGFDMVLIAKPTILSVKSLDQLQDSVSKQYKNLFILNV